MPRPRKSSTITHGDLKFRPVSDRGTKQDEAGRTMRYWRCSRYLGRENGRAVRQSYPALWAVQDDLPEIAARYARGETERPLPHARASASDFKATATAGMILQAWMTFRTTEEADSLSPRTISNCKRDVGLTKGLAFRKVRASAVGRPALDALVRDLRKSYGTRSTENVLRTIVVAFRWAYDRGYVPRPLNISVQIARLHDEARRDPEKAKVREKNTPTIAQAQAVARWFLDHRPGRGPWVTVGYLLTLAVGNRRGALQHVRWNDLRPGEDDETPGVVHLRKTKTGPRDVYVSTPVLRQILSLRPAGVGEDDPLLVLPAPGGWKPVAVPTIERGLNKQIERACEALKVPHFSMQALRRLAAQERARWVVRNNGSLAAAAAQAGQVVRTFLMYYEQARHDEIKAVAAALDYALVPVEADVIPLRRAEGSGEQISGRRDRSTGPG